jgi:hypothetical protein
MKVGNATVGGVVKRPCARLLFSGGVGRLPGVHAFEHAR